MTKPLRTILEAPQWTGVEEDDPEYGRLTGSEDEHWWGYPEHLEQLESGHHLYRAKTPAGATSYFVTDPSDSQILMRVGQHQPSSTLMVSRLQGLEGSNFKAHHLYHAILKGGHAGSIMSDNYLSDGGFRVWERLADMPGIEVHKVGNTKGYPKVKVMKGADIEDDAQNDPNTRYRAYYTGTHD